MTSILRLPLAVAIVFLLLACGDDASTGARGPDRSGGGAGANNDAGGTDDGGLERDGTSSDDGQSADAGPGDDDAGTGDARDDDAGGDDAVAPPEDAGGSEDTAMEDAGADTPDDATMVTLFGVVTRSVEPQAGGVGDLFVAVMDRDPVTSFGAAEAVAVLRLESVDMTADDVAVAYELPGIPPRGEPYFISAFLDDNGNASPGEDAGPDRGDLVTLDGISSPSVTLNSAGRVEHDIDLNAAMPF